MIGQPQIPLEMRLVGHLTLTAGEAGWPGNVCLYECPLCRALVTKRSAQPHADLSLIHI